MNTILSFIINAIISIVLWILRIFFKLNRLDKIDLIPLKKPFQEAIGIYNEPIESEPDDKFPEATNHTFDISPFHEIIVTEWNGLIHQVVYWSSHSSPTKDLKAVMQQYGNQLKWTVINEGYDYIREDNEILLWCSAMPVIGIASSEYKEAVRNSLKT